MVLNTCTPSNEYGPFEHTLFLGCSVMSFSASQGWNEQVSEVTVQLVEDDCSGTKVYWDDNLDKQTLVDVDPGFSGLTNPIIGAPVYFRMGDFEFAGLCQGWEEGRSSSGNPSYQVKIVDPRAILSNCQMIINEYAGGIDINAATDVYNLINVYGYAETLGVSCFEKYQSAPGIYSLVTTPAHRSAGDGSVFGSEAAFFGGADVNNNGMQWNQILATTQTLLSRVPINANALPWSPYGRLALKAPVTVGNGYGMMPADVGGLAYYYVDLSEVPSAPTYWRLNGTNVSMLDAITQVTKDAGFDYYIELIPVIDNPILGAGIHKFIKVRTIDRSFAPSTTFIDQFISGNDVISNSKGLELRNEPTSSFVIGGPKQSYYQIEQDLGGAGEADDIIIPYFGVDKVTQDTIIPTKDGDGYWEFDVNTDGINLQLAPYTQSLPATITINEKELLAAQAGFDEWQSIAFITNADSITNLTLPNGADALFTLASVYSMLENLGAKDEALGRDIKGTKKEIHAGNDNPTETDAIQTLFNWIRTFVTQFYGKKFQVRVPPDTACGKVDSESGIVQRSEEPADGGYSEVSTIVGLSNPSSDLDYFLLEDNRIGAMCRFDDANLKETAKLNPENFVSASNKLWTKVSIDPAYVYEDKSAFLNPRAVITLSVQVGEREDVDIAKGVEGIVKAGEFQGAIVRADMIAIAKDLTNLIAGADVRMMWPARPQLPDGAGFGIKSNVLSYGPWSNTGVAGGVAVHHDDGLVPWEYGGFTGLNLAGNLLATEGITNMQVGEEGTVTVPGIPNIPLGAELESASAGGPFFNSAGANLVENRVAASGASIDGGFQVFSSLPIWSGSFGPNVSNITVQVGENGLQTTYTMRTWTPKFGRFEKGNADRIKQVGTNVLKTQKQVRAFATQRSKINGGDSEFTFHGNPVVGDWVDNGAAGKTQRAGDGISEVIAGQVTQWNAGAYRRTPVATMSTALTNTELSANYDKKAFMSMDGLYRPISMDGDGGLPQFAIPDTGCQNTSSRGAQPPIDAAGAAGSFLQYNTNVDVNYLNPLSNPTGVGTRNQVQGYSDTKGVGHDIDIIGRGVTPPASSLVMPVEGYGQTADFADSDHSADYRAFALRGPLMMHGWGYDLDGFPVPNKADSEVSASGGIFTGDNLQQKFMDSFLRKPHTWPVAPIDLRFDRQRAVWTVPTYRKVIGVLQSELTANGSATAKIVGGGPSLWQINGTALTGAEFVVHEKVSGNVPNGSTVIAEYDPEACEYFVIESKPSGSGSGSDVLITDIACGGSSTSITSQTLNHAVFGSGLEVVQDGDTHVIHGGLRFADVSGCEPLASSTAAIADRRYDILKYNDESIRISQDGDECTAVMKAGIRPYNISDCIKLDDSLDADRLVHRVKYGKGLHARNPVAVDGSGCTVEVGAGLTVALNTDCFSAKTPDVNSLYSNLLIGKGLVASGEADCDLYLRGGVTVAASTAALQEGSITAGQHFSDMTLYRGLYALDNILDDCGLNLAGGLVLSSGVSGCNPPKDGANDITATRMYSKFNYNAECIRIRETTGDDHAIDMKVGVRPSSDNSLNVQFSDTLTADNMPHRLTFGKGMAVRDKVGEECTLEMAAGVTFTGEDLCFGESLTNSNLIYNELFFGKGLVPSGNAAGGDLHIRAGLNFAKDNVCYTGASIVGTDFISTINLGGGLDAQKIGDCEIGISAGTIVDVAAALPVVGDPITPSRNYNDFVFHGFSLTEDVSNPCQLHIYPSGSEASGSGIIPVNNDICVTGTNVSLALVGRAQTIKYGAGLRAINDGTEAIQLGAGASFVEITNACEPSSAQTNVTANQLYSTWNFNNESIRIKKDSNCAIGIKAGSLVTQTSYLSSPEIQPSGTLNNTLVHRFHLGKGLAANNTGGEECGIDLSSGITAGVGTACFGAKASNSDNIHSNLIFHRGIVASGDVGSHNLDLRAGVVAVDGTSMPATGAVVPTQTYSKMSFYGFEIGADASDPCAIHISGGTGGSGVSPGTTASCIAGGTQSVTSAATMNFGRGIHWKDSGANSIDIGAGLTASVNTACFSALTPDAGSLYNNLSFGNGIVVSGEVGCDLSVRAGIKPTYNKNLQILTNTGSISNTLVHDITFGRGTIAEDKSGSECAVEVVAGMQIGSTGGCNPTGDQTDVLSTRLYSKLYYNTESLRIKQNASDNMGMDIKSGLKITETGYCVDPTGTSPVSTELYHALRFGNGMSVEKINECTVVIGAGVLASEDAGTDPDIGGLEAVSAFDRYNDLVFHGLTLRGETSNDCALHIFASGAASSGITPATESVCWTGGTQSYATATTIKFGKGLDWQDDATANTIRLKSGILPIVPSSAEWVDPGVSFGGGLRSDFVLGLGLFIKNDDISGSNECGMVLGAGVKATKESTCMLPNTASISSNYSELHFYKGLNISGVADEHLHITAGNTYSIDASTSTAGLPTASASRLYNDIVVHGTTVIKGDNSDTCKLHMFPPAGGGFTADWTDSCVGQVDPAGASFDSLNFHNGTHTSGNGTELHVSAGVEVLTNTAFCFTKPLVGRSFDELQSRMAFDDNSFAIEQDSFDDCRINITSGLQHRASDTGCLQNITHAGVPVPGSEVAGWADRSKVYNQIAWGANMRLEVGSTTKQGQGAAGDCGVIVNAGLYVGAIYTEEMELPGAIVAIDDVEDDCIVGLDLEELFGGSSITVDLTTATSITFDKYGRFESSLP